MRLSICIPTYRRLEYLQQCVAGVLAQTEARIEVCVSQDALPGGNPLPEITAYGQSLAREGAIRFRVNAVNRGLSGNLNELARMATGDYVIFPGDDDLLHPQFAATLSAVITTQQPDVVFCNQYFINKTGRVLTAATENLNRKYGRDTLAPGPVQKPVEAVLSNSIPLSAACIKRALVLQYPFDESVNTPDLPFFLELAQRGHSFYYVPEKLCYYRIHAASATDQGLTLDTLLAKLISMPVRQQEEAAKSSFIQPKMITAVNMAMRNGNTFLAKQLLRSAYYPRSKKKLIQYGLLLLPPRLLKSLFSLKNRLRTTNADSIALREP